MLFWSDNFYDKNNSQNAWKCESCIAIRLGQGYLYCHFMHLLLLQTEL